MRASLRLWAALGIIAPGTVVAGCSSDETTPIDVGPVGNPELAFTDPASGSEVPCVSLGDEADARVPLLTRTAELVLRPPGACEAFAQCGHLVLYAGGVRNNESAAHAVELLVRKLADPYHDGSPHQGTNAPDYLRLSVEVVGDDGVLLADHNGAPLRAEVDVITEVDCPGAD